MRPREVNITNEHAVMKRIRKSTARTQVNHKKFIVGDKVRISKFKRTFAKGYIPNWTNEVFTVHAVLPTIPVSYHLRDNDGNLVKGSFYGQEMMKTRVGDVYLIEKVLQRKGDRLKVRWLGFDGKHDSWINKKDVV